MMKFLVRMFASTAFLLVSAANAQPSLAQLQADLVSPWFAVVDGEGRPRTLRIQAVEPGENGAFTLNAMYAFSDLRLASVKAEIVQTGQDRTLQLTTQSNSKIVATQKADGAFVGTFTDSSGRTKGLRIEKVSESELKAKVDAAARGPEILKPSPDVPAACAAYSGKWTGTWGYGIGQQWLWIPNIDNKCVAKVIYSSSKWAHGKVEMVEIKDGTLSIVCGGVDTCRFNVKGDELWATAYGSAGANNNAVFRRTE
jgi:hypothetical protein